MTPPKTRDIYMVQNDLNPPVDFDIFNDDEERDEDTGCITKEASKFDLTGCTVRFYMKGPDGTVVNNGHPVCQIIGDPTLGQARYNFVSGDTAKAGMFKCDVEVTDASNLPQTEFTVTRLHIRPQNG